MINPIFQFFNLKILNNYSIRLFQISSSYFLFYFLSYYSLAFLFVRIAISLVLSILLYVSLYFIYYFKILLNYAPVLCSIFYNIFIGSARVGRES